jgi:3-deoxy-D-manno-octulosonic-acid transferase
MSRLLDAVYCLALLLLSPWLLWRRWRTGRYRNEMGDKLRGLSRDIPTGAVWFHAVSVGEVHVLRQLVGAFRKRHPDRACVISSTTDTGLAEARKCFDDLEVFAFPFDFSWAVERTLRRVRPALIVLCESELWPNFIRAAKAMHVPVAVVNARMSPRSLGRYRLLGPAVRWLFGSLDLAAVQTEEYAANLLALGGVPGQVVVTGSIKYDGALMDRENPRTLALRELFGVTGDDLIWVAGSTLAPEEEIVLRIYRRVREAHRGLRLFVVPRQPDRFDEVARLLEKSRLEFVRRSALSPASADIAPQSYKPDAQARDTSAPSLARRACGQHPVVLVDTIGELGPLWGLADVAFVGGSLDGRRGGQNMIEPAAFGAAVTFGPHVWNFKEPARRLVEVGGAYQASSAGELEEIVCRLLGDAAERRAAGKAARAFVLAQQGATERTLELLDQLLVGRGEAERAA